MIAQRREPHLPVESRLKGFDPGRGAPQVTGLGFKFIGKPGLSVVAPFNNDFGAGSGHDCKETVTIEVAPDEPFVLQPRDFVLAVTLESLELDSDVLGRLEGRSSLGRIGIIVHGTAGLFDPGWSGKATLELSNLSRMAVALYPGMRICSFTFEQLSSPSAVPY